MGAPYSSMAVANVFLSLAWQNNKKFTNLDLQKLVFFANGWFMGVKKTRLIKEDAEAWCYGPVFRSLYNALKGYGKEPVTEFIECEDRITKEDDTWFFEFITIIFNKYKDCTTSQLVALSHQVGSPWQKALADGRNIISDEDILGYYEKFIPKDA